MNINISKEMIVNSKVNLIITYDNKTSRSNKLTNWQNILLFVLQKKKNTI